MEVKPKFKRAIDACDGHTSEIVDLVTENLGDTELVEPIHDPITGGLELQTPIGSVFVDNQFTPATARVEKKK